MMRPLFDITTLKGDIDASPKDDINTSALILTSNNRLASKIRQAWGQHKQEQQHGHSCWVQPEIHAIEQWIHEQWQCCCDRGLEEVLQGSIIPQVLEQRLWEQVIEEDSDKPANILAANFSTLASNSYRIIQRWQIPLAELTQCNVSEKDSGKGSRKDSGADSETEFSQEKTVSALLLHRWIKVFRSKLKQHQLITLADSAAVVLNAYKNGDITPQSQIITVGFDSIPPLYQTLLNAAAKTVKPHLETTAEKSTTEAGSSSIASCPRITSCSRINYYDEQQEFMAAAAWAAQKQRDNPEQRIGIVVPALTQKRAQIERIFRQQLEPAYQLPQQHQSPPPFNLSVGVPLSKTPMVASALLLLSLNRQQLPLEDLCRLLNSPFWGDKVDKTGNKTQVDIRANTENKLRYLARHNISTSEFRYQLYRVEQAMAGIDSESAKLSSGSSINTDFGINADPDNNDNFDTSPGLSATFMQMENLRREMPSKTSFQQWLQLFQQQLDTVLWPGQRTLDSIEYQQYQHWLRTLEQYSALDQLQLEPTAANVSLEEALRQLRYLTEQCIFQAETEDSPIQILGLLESNGLRFDHLWVTGMDNHSWPPSIAPNPLLPIHLQRKYATPRSQPERELQLAQAQIDGLKQAADNVIFSHSEFDGSQQRQASRLIIDLPELEPSSLSMVEQGNLPQEKACFKPTVLEKVPCINAPSLDLESGYDQIRGGSSIFKDQASCPFNAFARHRLGAKKPPDPRLGLSAMDRGSLLHDCLEQLWQQLGSQQQLLSLSDQDIDQLTHETVATALLRWKKKRPDLFGPQFSHIEQQRLVELLQQWLTLEKTRPDFNVIAFEKTVETDFSGLPLKLIIDRIDELQDGNQVIIDYKTGTASTNSWLGDRPEQPQLPLYVLCSESPVAAATFAVINVSQQQFVGFSETPNLLPDIEPPGKKNEPENWSELLDHWQQSLTQLAEEFKRGYAPVTLHKPTALQYQQELEPLNRMAELSSNAREISTHGENLSGKSLLGDKP